MARASQSLPWGPAGDSSACWDSERQLEVATAISVPSISPSLWPLPLLDLYLDGHTHYVVQSKLK